MHNCLGVSAKPDSTTTRSPSFLLSFNASCLVAVVGFVSCFDANANPGRQTDSTYCPLYRRTENIISWHKRRCHSVHQCEPCLNIEFLSCTRGGSFDLNGGDLVFMSDASEEASAVGKAY